MYKLKRNIKNYWVLFSTFFIINIFFIDIVVNIINIEQELKTQQSLMSNNAKIMFFQCVEKVKVNDVIELLKGNNVILEGNIISNNDEEKTDVKGIYYNYNIEKQYPLIDGRMFSLDEINNREKVALVGEGIKDRIKDNIIKIQNTDYKVVGILGKKGSDSLKNSIFINMNAEDFSLDMKAITIDVENEQTANIVMSINKKLENKASIYVSEAETAINPLNEAVSQNRVYIVMAILASICLITTVINISIYWIDKEKSVIGIQSLVGATKRNISFRFFLRYEFIIVLSLISACLLWEIFNFNNGGNQNAIFRSVGILAIINMIVSTLSIIVPLINLNKLNISSIIKENI